MTDQEIQQIPILNVLPQRRPFVFVDRMMHYEELVMVTETTVSSDCILGEDNQMSASGIVENIAQTCAARIGFINKYILHKDICIGVIGAIKNLVIDHLPKVGETPTTRIEILSSAFGISLAAATVTSAETGLIAEGEMKISLTETVVDSDKSEANG